MSPYLRWEYDDGVWILLATQGGETRTLARLYSLRQPTPEDALRIWQRVGSMFSWTERREVA